jgi:hypothetical protein
MGKREKKAIGGLHYYFKLLSFSPKRTTGILNIKIFQLKNSSRVKKFTGHLSEFKLKENVPLHQIIMKEFNEGGEVVVEFIVGENSGKDSKKSDTYHMKTRDLMTARDFSKKFFSLKNADKSTELHPQHSPITISPTQQVAAVPDIRGAENLLKERHKSGWFSRGRISHEISNSSPVSSTYSSNNDSAYSVSSPPRGNPNSNPSTPHLSVNSGNTDSPQNSLKTSIGDHVVDTNNNQLLEGEEIPTSEQDLKLNEWELKKSEIERKLEGVSKVVKEYETLGKKKGKVKGMPAPSKVYKDLNTQLHDAETQIDKLVKSGAKSTLRGNRNFSPPISPIANYNIDLPSPPIVEKRRQSVLVKLFNGIVGGSPRHSPTNSESSLPHLNHGSLNENTSDSSNVATDSHISTPIGEIKLSDVENSQKIDKPDNVVLQTPEKGSKHTHKLETIHQSPGGESPGLTEAEAQRKKEKKEKKKRKKKEGKEKLSVGEEIVSNEGEQEKPLNLLDNIEI